MTGLRTVPTVVLALAALQITPAAAGAQSPAPAQRIVELARPSPVREYAGWLLFSRWDGAAYRLSTYHEGAVRDLAVPAQAEAFDADAGPDSAGRPSAVVSLCAASCDLFVTGFKPGDGPRPVANANTTSDDEVSPTVWNGRLAFARRYDANTLVPYTKRLQAPRARPSDRLASLPARRCGAVDPPQCRPIKDVRLRGLELWGRWVAQSWTYQPDGFPGFRQNELRLTDVARTDTRQLAAMVTGLGGQTYLGPSIADGRVAFFRACQGDPGGCSTSTSGALRYRISTGRYEIVGGNEAWSSWAWDGTAGFHVASADGCGQNGAPTAAPSPCAIIRRPDPDWTPIAGDHLR